MEVETDTCDIPEDWSEIILVLNVLMSKLTKLKKVSLLYLKQLIIK